jgi:hypothetical protein
VLIAWRHLLLFHIEWFIIYVKFLNRAFILALLFINSVFIRLSILLFVTLLQTIITQAKKNNKPNNVLKLRTLVLTTSCGSNSTQTVTETPWAIKNKKSDGIC